MASDGSYSIKHYRRAPWFTSAAALAGRRRIRYRQLSTAGLLRVWPFLATDRRTAVGEFLDHLGASVKALAGIGQVPELDEPASPARHRPTRSGTCSRSSSSISCDSRITGTISSRLMGSSLKGRCPRGTRGSPGQGSLPCAGQDPVSCQAEVEEV